MPTITQKQAEGLVVALNRGKDRTALTANFRLHVFGGRIELDGPAWGEGVESSQVNHAWLIQRSTAIVWEQLRADVSPFQLAIE